MLHRKLNCSTLFNEIRLHCRLTRKSTTNNLACGLATATVRTVPLKQNRALPSAFSHCIKTNLDAKPFIWKCLLSCKTSTFQYERLCVKTRLGREVKGNSEMAYLPSFPSFFSESLLEHTNPPLRIPLIESPLRPSKY